MSPAVRPVERPGGRLVLAATPIGDALDASPRLIQLLTEAGLIAAEDTRRLHRLLSALGVEVTAKIISYHEHNEATRGPELVAAVGAGDLVVLVTDAGMPGVSDPGLRAVQACAEAGLLVTSVPGPSAALTALALSGLPTDRFCFEGFPPRTSGRRIAAFAELAAEKRTMIFFESPRRTASCLADMASAFGDDRPAAVCRELTKTHEEIQRGPLSSLVAWAAEREILGEVTIVVAGAVAAGPRALEGPFLEELATEVRSLRGEGSSMRKACAEVAQRHDLATNALYAALTSR